MAIDISGLTLLAQRSPEIIGKLLNRESVLRMFVPHEGYNPGPALLRLYEGGGDLGACCEVPEGSGEFSQVQTTVACILSGNEFCEQDLATYLNDLNFRFTAGSESLDGTLEEMVTDQELAKIALNLDRLVFQGDTTSPNANLNRIDGLIKLARENADPDNVITIPATSNIYAAIEQVIMAIPVEAYDQGDIAILVGRDVAKAIQAALVGNDMFNYNPGSRGVYDPIAWPGVAGVSIIPTRGLDGTNTIIATPLNNIHWLTNLADDYMTLSWGYTEYHQLYYFRTKFLLGLTYAIYDNVVLATFDAAVLTNGSSTAVSIVSPLGSNGGVLTTETA